MTTSFRSRLLQNAVAKSKGPKANGFTLIELMVVIVIVGILSAVGAPQLFKAQDAAVDTAAKALAVNQSKECSAELLLGDGSGFTGKVLAADDKLTYSAPTCAADAVFSVAGVNQTWEVTLTSGFPGDPVDVTTP